jgi:hypothetical protein
MAGRRFGGFGIRADSRAVKTFERHRLPYGRGSVTLFLAVGLAASPPPLKEFSHAKHLKLGNVAPAIASAIDKGTYLGRDGAKIRPLLNSTNPCMACHRELDSGANMPQMADCLVCHNQIDLPDSCAFCHPKEAQLKPASHGNGFLDTHTNKNSGLDLQSCAVCHGRKFTCLGCHLK